MLKSALSHKGSIREAFKNEDGAIDLASIMVGIIVIGIIGGVIAATVFAVIPWAQDNAAKGALDSVATAESAYRGFTADGGVAVFASETQLNAPATTIGNGAQLLAASDSLFIDTNGTTYSAFTKSSSGKFFKSVDGTKAVEVTSTTTPNLVTVKAYVFTGDSAVKTGGVN